MALHAPPIAVTRGVTKRTEHALVVRTERMVTIVSSAVPKTVSRTSVIGRQGHVQNVNQVTMERTAPRSVMVV